jgi:hypothetical protein
MGLAAKTLPPWVSNYGGKECQQREAAMVSQHVKKNRENGPKSGKSLTKSKRVFPPVVCYSPICYTPAILE